MSSLSISPCQDHGLKPSTAYTEYSIQWVQHTPMIVWLPFILMITNWPLNVASASGVCPYTIYRHQPSSPWELRGKVTLSHSHSCELTNWWIVSQHPARHLWTATKYSCNLARWQPPSASPNPLDHDLQVHLQTSLITASKVHPETSSITASKYISKLTQLLPPIHTVMASTPSAYLQTHLSRASKCMSNLAQSRPRSISLSSLDLDFQAHLDLLWCTACSQVQRYRV